MKYTIEDLRNGKCAVRNDGTAEELIEVLSLAFPEDKRAYLIGGAHKFYYKSPYNNWGFSMVDSTELPTQSVKDFLEPEFKRGDKVMVGGHERIFLAKIDGAKYPYIYVSSSSENDFLSGRPFRIATTGKVEPIPKKEVPEYTMKEAIEKMGYEFKIKGR
jgi:hypothetical protein